LFRSQEEDIEDLMPLKAIYDKVRPIIQTQKEVEPLLEMDRDEKKLDTLLRY
jgi:ankyrin repeat-rich membrane spanning protein